MPMLRWLADLGSKPWLLANALHDDSTDAPAPADASAKTAAAKAIRPLPPVRDDDELPEDRFHRADIVSSHLLMQARVA